MRCRAHRSAGNCVSVDPRLRTALNVSRTDPLVHVGVWNWAQTPSDAAKGWTEDTNYDYENMNFGLCRLLSSTVSGAVAKSTTYTPSYLNDPLWDLNTINAYQSYMQAKVRPLAGWPS
jgi:hypothetical protein